MTNKHNTPSNRFDLYMYIDKKQKKLEKKVTISYLWERFKNVVQNKQ